MKELLTSETGNVVCPKCGEKHWGYGCPRDFKPGTKPTVSSNPKGYTQYVPGQCDRIVWRGSVYMLPLPSTPSPDETLQPASNERLSDTNLRNIRSWAENHLEFSSDDSGPRMIAEAMDELLMRRRAAETNSCAKFRIGDDVVVTRWHAPAKVKGFIYELEEPFQYPERERDLSPPAQKAGEERS